IAGIEKDENVGADKSVGTLHAGQVLASLQQRVGGTIFSNRQRRLGAFGKSRNPLQDSIFIDAKIRVLQPIDVVILAVLHLEAEHHHVHLHLEGGDFFLGAGNRRARCHSNESSSSPHGCFIDPKPYRSPTPCAAAFASPPTARVCVRTSSPTDLKDFSNAVQSSS